MKKKIWLCLFIAGGVTAVLLLSVVFLRQQGRLLPFYIPWMDRTIRTDLTGDGSEELISLAKKRATVISKEEEIFLSEKDWKVQDILTEDIDEDGTTELLLLTWRKGNYGTSRPFWVDENEGEETWSQHIFVYRYEEGRVRPVWMSSDIGLDVKGWSMGDDKVLHLRSKDGSETSWKWDSWGFALMEEDEPA